MSRPVRLTESQWMKIYHNIAANYPHSVLLIRDKMRSVLGFTSRTHHWHDPVSGYRSCIMLDFYDEPKRTMFLLKYGDYLQDDQ
jgi:hypothetical protein